ncbi:3-oxoacyl-[acyl-carrier-protein] synthase-3 [Granulicella aggregans]|uniref:3-oxoacyl-[acyl-carrier-protein] synthase-3 n=1 Tax=Granulicella aggregans TaxID=474949 RepID=A0A7W7ZF98_9BACT|nr:ketoacyl-ACP synthase III [Granulicella aggregans]MBB5058855.1 3-oxoacyl-[acyl-carrier-protein] synthase-3 [Granulicella aggregans]
MHGYIANVAYFLPARVETTRDLASRFPGGSIERIAEKTGILQRHISADGECASDLACAAAEALFDSAPHARKEVDFILFCTQSPDYILPTTACLLQKRLGISTTAGALDFNLGCSGYVYGLGLAQGLIASGQAKSILLVTADTYTKYLREDDKSARAIFGDGAAATLIKASREIPQSLGPFVYGTDGGGADDLIVPNSGMRRSSVANTESGEARSSMSLHMNGPNVFSFAVKTVPESVRSLLERSSVEMADVDLFVFHQANVYLLEEIRRILSIPEDKYQLTLGHCGNTVSSSIPIALRHAQLEGRLFSGALVVLVGFGVGFSWAAALVKWTNVLNN